MNEELLLTSGHKQEVGMWIGGANEIEEDRQVRASGKRVTETHPGTHLTTRASITVALSLRKGQRWEDDGIIPRAECERLSGPASSDV